LTDGAIRGADEGLYVAPGIQNLLVERMRFESNRIGIRLESAATGIVVRNNRFSRHGDAAVWAVRGAPSYDAGSRGFALHSNNFEEDRMSLVLGNTPAQVEYNEFVKNGEVAVYLIGAGAVVRGNRIRNGGGIGVFVDATQGTLIDSNEIDHNHALAVLVRHSRDALLQGNRIYDNGYGIVFVLNEHGAPNVAAENSLYTQRFDGIVVIGDSPVLRRNLAMKNRSAGIRVLDFYPLAGARIPARPFLDRNTLEGNTPNEPTQGEYRDRVADRNS
jgi:nitrous oxidase accessory protein NosD